VRNPHDRYVSQYAFPWWKEHPPREWFDLDAVRAKYPHWPEVFFEEFVDAFRRLKGSPLPPEMHPVPFRAVRALLLAQSRAGLSAHRRRLYRGARSFAF
jgi:hypothetical protein